MQHHQQLTLVFGAGLLTGTSSIAVMNSKQTIANMRKAYEQLTFENIVGFCGTVWMSTLAYKYTVKLFHK